MGGFLNALSFLAPVAPASAQADEIRRQRAIQAEQLQRQRDTAAVQAQEAQQRIRKANEPAIFGNPEWDAAQNKYTVLALDPAKGIVRMPVPGGESPEAEQTRKAKQEVATFKQVTGRDPTPEEQVQMAYSVLGVKSPPASYKQLSGEAGKPFKGNDGQWYVNEQGPEGIVPRPLGPNYNPPQKTLGRDDKYIAIVQKLQLKQPLTPEESAYKSAYDFWTNKTKVAPGIARAYAFGASRIIPVIGDDNESVVYMPAGQAARSGARSPQSIGFVTDRAIQRAFTSGKQSQNIASFNTLTQHLQVLKDASTALNNGDIPAFNSLAQRWAQATGNPVPTNFDAIKTGASSEFASVLKGAGATDQEIATTSGLFNRAGSPAQLYGSLDMVTQQMNGRLSALRSQYEAGKSGQPAFPGYTTPVTPGKKGKVTKDNPLGLDF